MKRCLIVDDSSVVRKIARHHLERLGYEVSEAENGKEALESYKSGYHDAILLDWQLPVMGAQEFLTGLRIASRGRRPFVVYMPTEYDFQDINRAYSSGVDDVMMKPFDGSDIREKFGAINKMS
ncbi:MAG: response regulator [Hyphomicrobium sp.]|nr:response regulator [Hyphomicrobium sp.]